jgi:putative endonuclease
MKKFYVYILSSINKTLYIWITNNLQRRIFEHKNKLNEWFTEKYKINKLVYYVEFNNSIDAINTEKRLKKYNRQWKIDLIEKYNPTWKDLSLDFINFN